MQTHEELGAGAYYRFDTYTLDPDSRTLRCAGKLVDLTPKVFSTLLVLVENRDRILTKDELLAIIWPDQFVDQSNLSQNISVLRRSLGEAETGKKYIATFPGRGYRFVGPVEIKHQGEDSGAAAASDAPRSAVEGYPASPGEHDVSPQPAQSERRLLPRKSVVAIRAGLLVIGAIAAVALGLHIRNPRPVAIHHPAPLKVFARMNSGLTQPRWSRDGNAIAFVALDLSGTQSAIYVQSKGDVQAHKVLSDAGQFSSPAWSPDGRQLAFLHFQPDRAELAVFDIQDRTLKVVTKLFPHRYGLNYRHLDWSPDGKFLVVDDKTQDSEPFSLYLIYLASGQRVRLTYPDSDMIGDLSPSVSPDGEEVAFIRNIDHFEQDIYITTVRGRTYRRITSAHTRISDVEWKTDQTLALAANYDEGYRLWQVDVTKQDQRESPASQVDSDRAMQFSIAPNGQSIAFSSYNPDLEIWSLDASKPADRWVPVIQAPGESIRPAISPDGKLLAFLSNVSGHYQIWVSQLDGTHASALSTGALVPASFCWSANGRSIIFSPQGIHGLYQVPLQSNAAVKQISSIYTDPHYAVDGKSLFVRAHFFIYRLPLLGGKPQEVTEQGGAPLAQSRDGRYLYFSQGRMSTTIARLDLRTGHQDELTGALIPGYSGAWALSSKGAFFLGREQDQPAIRFLDFSTNADRHVASFPGDLPEVEMSGFGISPDGERLWVVRADPMPSDIKVTQFQSN